jgi:hypothetical protein
MEADVYGAYRISMAAMLRIKQALGYAAALPSALRISRVPIKWMWMTA